MSRAPDVDSSILDCAIRRKWTIRSQNSAALLRMMTRAPISFGIERWPTGRSDDGVADRLSRDRVEPGAIPAADDPEHYREDCFAPLARISQECTAMHSTLDRLNALIREVVDLRHAADLLEWDERVCMPSGGAPTHGEMLSTVRKLAHEQFTAAEVGRLLDAAAREVASADLDADHTRLVAVTARDYRKATQVPAAFVAEQAEAVSAAQHAWGAARAKNDFASFRPHLERVIALKRQYINFFPPADHPYDVLLDDFEPGMKTAEVKVILDELRTGQVELLRAIASRPQIDDACLRVTYAEADLYKFAVEVITKFGFDWERGRQDKSTHPFATAIGSNDVRITTRFMERYPF